jgi:group I intron endonuclease
MGYIYLVTNKINGMKYIGQTISKDIEKRWNQHKIVQGRAIGRFLKSAYIKYGIDKFKFQIICICFDEDCNKYEEEYIKKFNTMAPNGYNLREGGKNSKLSEATKQLQREATTRRMANPELRKKCGKKGPEHPNYGKIYSKEEREELRKKCKAFWDNLSEEKKKERSNKRKEIYKLNGLTDKQYSGLKIGHNLLKKKVGKYDNNGNLLQEYTSVSEASQKTNICRGTISKVCLQRPKYHTAGGFIWKFI